MIVFRLVVVAVQLGVLVLIPVARLLDAVDWARERLAAHRL